MLIVLLRKLTTKGNVILRDPIVIKTVERCTIRTDSSQRILHCMFAIKV